MHLSNIIFKGDILENDNICTAFHRYIYLLIMSITILNDYIWKIQSDNEIFTLCSEDTTSQDFMTGSSLAQPLHQIIIFWETEIYSVALLQSVPH